jgi:hypothetical protein
MIDIVFDAKNIKPKIATVEGARTELTNFIKNPPQNPVAAIKAFADMSGVTGALAAGLTVAFPLAGFALSALSGILDAFSSGPSIGEVTLNAISQGFQQVGEQLHTLQTQLTDTIDASRALTVQSVLSGVDQVAREQSAIAVFESANEYNAIIAEQAAKVELFSSYQKELEFLTKQSISQIENNIDSVRAQVDAEYLRLAEQIKNMVLNVSGDLLSRLDDYIETPDQLAAALTERAAEADLPPFATSNQVTIAGAPTADAPLLLWGAIGVGAFFLLTRKDKKR